MTDLDELIRRNAAFAAGEFKASSSINPGGNLMVIGCVDPRVDPACVLGLEQGEAAVIRNVGGRVTPATLSTLAMLRKVGEANRTGRPTGDWNLVILHHTDCGMTDLAAFPELLAAYFDVASKNLPGKAVSDPYGSVRVDADIALREVGRDSFLVSGLVYDVRTGRVDTVVAPTRGPRTVS